MEGNEENLTLFDDCPISVIFVLRTNGMWRSQPLGEAPCLRI
jgi:hypothetical protein